MAEKNRTNQGRNDDATREGPIEERLLDEGRTSQRDIVTAAQEAFVEDQKDPNHPSRIERSHGVEDPSHSKGSPRDRSS